MSLNVGLNPQKDNFHVTREGAGAAGTTSPLTLTAVIQTITLPVSGNSITFFPSEPTRIGYTAAHADGFFIISAPYTISFSQELFASVFYRSDAAVPPVTATLGIDIGMQ